MTCSERLVVQTCDTGMRYRLERGLEFQYYILTSGPNFQKLSGHRHGHPHLGAQCSNQTSDLRARLQKQKKKGHVDATNSYMFIQHN